MGPVQKFLSCPNLDQVIHLWGLSKKGESERPQLIETLRQRMIQPLVARCVWERLATSQERLVLWHCVGKSVRNGLKRRDLLARTKLTTEEFDVALAQLTGQLLLVEELPSPAEGPAQAHADGARASAPSGMEPRYIPAAQAAEALYQTGREIFMPGAQRTAMSLSKLLQSCSEPELRRMVHHYALDPTGLRRKSDLRVALAEALTDADLVQSALCTLDASIQEVHSWLVEQGGQACMRLVRTHFAIDNDELFALLETLAAYGLAFDTLSPDVPGLRLLFLPQALVANSEAPVSLTGQHGLVPLSTVPATVEEGVPTLVGDLAVVVNAVYQQRVELTRGAETVVKHCMAKIEPLLRGRIRPGMLVGNVYPGMLFEMARRLLLIQPVYPPFSLQSLKPYYEPAPGIRSWSRLTLVEQTQRLLSWWTTSANWDDVVGSDFQQWNSGTWKPLAARPLLISALRQCVPGAWYGIDDLLQILWETEPYALRPGGEQGAHALRPTTVLKAKWLRCEGAVLRGILTSTLWELGLVSLGCTEGSSQDVFGLTELGAAVLHLIAPDDSTCHAAGDSLVFLPTGEVLLLELDTAILYRLLPYVKVHQVDRAIRLAFTRSSITRAIDHGHSLQALLEFLENEGYQIPQNVRYMLKDWAINFKVAEFKHVLLISVSSEEVARVLVTAPRLRAWGLRQLAPTIVAAPAHAHLGELRRALETEGIAVRLGKDLLPFPAPYIPQQSEEDAATKVTSTGRAISFPHEEAL